MTDAIQTVREALHVGAYADDEMALDDPAFAALNRVEAVVKAAREEHHPTSVWSVTGGDFNGWCSCGRAYPACPTVQALAALDPTEAPHG